jgi:hypothetical protein
MHFFLSFRHKESKKDTFKCLEHIHNSKTKVTPLWGNVSGSPCKKGNLNRLFYCTAYPETWKSERQNAKSKNPLSFRVTNSSRKHKVSDIHHPKTPVLCEGMPCFVKKHKVFPYSWLQSPKR